jgi:hypothetical protein
LCLCDWWLAGRGALCHWPIDLLTCCHSIDRLGQSCPFFLSAGGNADLVLNQLLKHTAVQSRFSANLVALVGPQPLTLTLKDFLRHFLEFRCGEMEGAGVSCAVPLLVLFLYWGKGAGGISTATQPMLLMPQHHPSALTDDPPTCPPAPCPPCSPRRCEVVERRGRHELLRAQQRLHLVDGFLAAMRDLDAVVHAIRQASDAAAAGAALQAEPFGLSREQSEGVLGMTLRRLTSLESNKLQEEQAQLRAK